MADSTWSTCTKSWPRHGAQNQDPDSVGTNELSDDLYNRRHAGERERLRAVPTTRRRLPIESTSGPRSVLTDARHYRARIQHDMRAIHEREHDAGALIVWDLAHSAERCPFLLATPTLQWDADTSMNGGPRAPLRGAPRHVEWRTARIGGSRYRAGSDTRRRFAFSRSINRPAGIARFICARRP